MDLIRFVTGETKRLSSMTNVWIIDPLSYFNYATDHALSFSPKLHVQESLVCNRFIRKNMILTEACFTSRRLSCAEEREVRYLPSYVKRIKAKRLLQYNNKYKK